MRVEKNIIVQRPINIVFAFITDMDKVKLWLPVDHVRQVSRGPINVGSIFTQQAHFLGQRFQATIEVTQYEPDRLFAFKMLEGPLPLSNTMSCRSTSTGGTILTMIGEADAKAAMKLMGPLIVPLVKKQLDTQMNLLKRALEAPK